MSTAISPRLTLHAEALDPAELEMMDISEPRGNPGAIDDDELERFRRQWRSEVKTKRREVSVGPVRWKERDTRSKEDVRVENAVADLDEAIAGPSKPAQPSQSHKNQ